MSTLPLFFRRLLKELPLLVLVALLTGSALSLFQASAAWAATPIYVRPDGNDTNCDGTTNDPYPGTDGHCAVKTIQQGIDLVDPSGTVYVAAGTYDGTLNIDTRTNLTIMGADPLTTIIKPSTTLPWIVGGYVPARHTVLRVVNSTGITISDLTFDLDLVKGNNIFAGLYWDSTGSVDGNIFKNNQIADTSGGYYELGLTLRAPGYTDASRAVITVNGNTFQDLGRVSLHLGNYVEATITGNTFYKIADDFGYAIELGSQSTGTISGNTFHGFDTPAASDGSNSAAIYVENCFTQAQTTAITKNVTISNNEIYDSQWGVYIGNEFNGYAGNVDIVLALTNNNIHNNTNGGVFIADEDKSAGSSVSVTGSGNTITNDGDYGYYISTAGDGNISANLTGETITGQDTGVYVVDTGAPSTSSYSVSIASSNLSGNTTYGIDNRVTGLTVLAEQNWWGTAYKPTIAAYISGGVDFIPYYINLGMTILSAPLPSIVYVNASYTDGSAGGHVYGYDAFAKIQEGIDGVAVAGTVNVAAGTYTEQVTITKDLSLLGAGQATTTVQALASMPSCFTTIVNATSYANHPVVCVMDAVATIDGFTIDGLGLGNSNVRFQGVAFRNAGGTLQNSTIKDIRDTPFSGSQHGVGVYAFNENTTHYTIHVLDNTLTGFQKTAIALNTGDTTPLTVDVQRNVVTGAGTTAVTAQNGIQVWADLGSGVVADNTIGGIAYGGSNWVATSILNYYANLDITGNTITGAHTGIYNIDGAGRIADNELTIIKAAGYAYGIIATDPPGAVPAPYEPQAKPEGKNLNSIGALAVLDVEVANNVLTFSGADKIGSSAIEADGGYGANDLSVNVHHNSVTGFDYGLTFYQCESSCKTGAFTGISAVSNDLLDNTKAIYLGGPIVATVIPTIHHNRFYGNVATDKGLVNDLTVMVTAENNWWGCNEGPANAACVGTTGLVDADLWLVLSAVADPATVQSSETSVVTADLIFNSAAINTSGAGYVPNGIPMAFTAPDGGTVNPITGATLNGADDTTFTAPVVDQAYQVCTEVDNELVCVNVTLNNAPVATADTYSTTEDTPLTVVAPGVLTNDTDTGGDTLTAVLVTDVSGGTLVLNADGSFTYTPDANFFGTDTFTYHANDGTLDSNVVTVTITVADIPETQYIHLPIIRK